MMVSNSLQRLSFHLNAEQKLYEILKVSLVLITVCLPTNLFKIKKFEPNKLVFDRKSEIHMKISIKISNFLKKEITGCI